MGYPGVWIVTARGNSLFTYALHAITELEQPGQHGYVHVNVSLEPRQGGTPWADIRHGCQEHVPAYIIYEDIVIDMSYIHFLYIKAPFLCANGFSVGTTQNDLHMA